MVQNSTWWRIFEAFFLCCVWDLIYLEMLTVFSPLWHSAEKRQAQEKTSDQKCTKLFTLQCENQLSCNQINKSYKPFVPKRADLSGGIGWSCRLKGRKLFVILYFQSDWSPYSPGDVQNTLHCHLSSIPLLQRHIQISLDSTMDHHLVMLQLCSQTGNNLKWCASYLNIGEMQLSVVL